MSAAAERARATPRIFYLVSDYAAPSWGQGMLYQHVRLLVEAGFDARVLHERRPFRLPWLDDDVPIAYVEETIDPPQAHDLVIVPEVRAMEALPWACRRGVFVQGSFLPLLGDRPAVRYPELGFEFALAVMPHVAAVVERHFGIAARLVPPCIAPYFLRSPTEIREQKRERRVLLAAKPDYRRAGFPDYDIVTKLVGRSFTERGTGWRLQELAGLSHRQVAGLMASTPLLINLNTHEAFNTSVPEAMAAGCVPVCYEAVGGRDFLTDGVDAFVFDNHHAYALVERLLELVEIEEVDPGRLLEMRLRARATAARFSEAATREALVAVFSELTGQRPAAVGR